MASRSLGWQFGMSAYWFAVSLKWFVLLTAVLPGQVEAITGDEKNWAWGQIVLVGAFWALFGPALFGAISDRIGRWKPFVAVGAALTTLALFLLPQSTELWHLALGYLLLQVADDFAQGPYSALVPRLVSTEQRGRASGVMGLLQLIAQIAGGVGAIALGSKDAIYLMIVGATITCAVITLLTVREDRHEPEASIRSHGLLVGIVRPWLNADFRWVWFTRFSNAVGFYLVYHYMRNFLRDEVSPYELFGWEVASRGAGTPEDLAKAAFQAVMVIALIISLIGAIGAVVGGKLADTVGRKRVVVFTGALMAVPILPLIYVRDFTALVLLALLFALGYGAYQASDWALAADVMPERGSLATDMGVWQSCMAAPQVISGGFGYIVQEANRQNAGTGYSLAFGIASVFFVLAIVFVSKIRGST